MRNMRSQNKHKRTKQAPDNTKQNPLVEVIEVWRWPFILAEWLWMWCGESKVYPSVVTFNTSNGDCKD